MRAGGQVQQGEVGSLCRPPAAHGGISTAGAEGAQKRFCLLGPSCEEALSPQGQRHFLFFVCHPRACSAGSPWPCLDSATHTVKVSAPGVYKRSCWGHQHTTACNYSVGRVPRSSLVQTCSHGRYVRGCDRHVTCKGISQVHGGTGVWSLRHWLSVPGF